MSAAARAGGNCETSETSDMSAAIPADTVTTSFERRVLITLSGMILGRMSQVLNFQNHFQQDGMKQDYSRKKFGPGEHSILSFSQYTS